MNATSYYVSTCRLVIQADPANPSSWQDIFRFLPMLRNSLSCTVCEKLLTEPYTPEETSCQHHVCKGCQGGVKVLRPSCSWCKDYDKYSENPQLRILIQSYRSLCSYIKVTQLYQLLKRNKEYGDQIKEIIQESASGMNHVPYLSSLSSTPLPELPASGPQDLRLGSHRPHQEEESGVDSDGAATSPIKCERLEEDGGDVCMANSPTDERNCSGDISEQGQWYCVTTSGQLIPEQDLKTPVKQEEPPSSLPSGERINGGEQEEEKEGSCGEIEKEGVSTRLSSQGGGVAGTSSSLRKSRKDKDKPSPMVVTSQNSARVKDEMFTTPNSKEDESFCTTEQKVDDEVSFRISSPAVSRALFLDNLSNSQNILQHPPSSQPPSLPAKDIFVSRSDTPSPPNSSKYSKVDATTNQLHPKLKITESYILKPRQENENSYLVKKQQYEEISPAADSRVPVMLARSDNGILNNQQHHNNSNSLLRPLIEDEGVDPLATSTTVSSPSSRGGKKAEDGKGGCRCGNATSSPGKLTCCGQRCPCYVNKSACLDCKCKGCNNPNLPGGGKLLPYLDIAINSKNNSMKMVSFSSAAGKVATLNLNNSGSRGSTVIGGTKAAGVNISGTVPTVATRGRLQVAAAGAGSRGSGGTTLLKGVSRAGGGAILDANATSYVQMPSTSQSADSITDVDINTIPVVNLSAPNSVRTLLAPSAVQRLLQTGKSKNSVVVGGGNAVQTATGQVLANNGAGTGSTTSNGLGLTSLPTVTIPISSLGPGLKLRPVHHIPASNATTVPVGSVVSGGNVPLGGGKQLKATRVIPTTIRVRGSPYSRLPVNGNVRLQTVSFVTLLKNDKNVQIVRKESEDTENTPTSS